MGFYIGLIMAIFNFKSFLKFASLVIALFGTPAFSQASFSAAELAAAPQCERFPSGQDGYLCSCDAGYASGSVWGSGPYTADSNICVAAQHSGVLSLFGGAIYATQQGGQDGYTGSEANGVTTRDWGAYGRSFNVELAVAGTFLEACSNLPNGVDSLTCACGASTGAAGSVWGSGPYTADSDICSAARHAGYLEDGAGTVNVLRIIGLESYVGSEWNGVASRNWGAYSSSIVFNGN